MQQWTRSKIQKIYPRLAKKKYNTPLPTELELQRHIEAMQITLKHEQEHSNYGSRANSSANISIVPSKSSLKL